MVRITGGISMNDLRTDQLVRDYHSRMKKKLNSNIRLLPPGINQQIQEKGYFLLGADTFFSELEKIQTVMHLTFPMAVAPHCHDFFELIYVYDGHVHHYIGDEEFTLYPKDICIINPNTIHHLSEIDDNTIIFNILIHKEMLSNAIALISSTDNIVFNFFSSCLYGQTKNTHILFKGDIYSTEDSLSFLHNIITESIVQKPQCQKAMEYSLQLFCLELTRTYMTGRKNTVSGRKKAPNDSIEQIIQYITDNFRTADIDSIAETFHYHPTYVPQLLKKNTGKTFMQIQQMIRISVAQDKLLHTSMNVEDISRYVGYSNTTHFHRIFKKITGVSPLQYRKQPHPSGANA